MRSNNRQALHLPILGKRYQLLTPIELHGTSNEGFFRKLVVNAAHYPLFTPSGGIQTFSDVPPSNVFFVSIETAHNKAVINGYAEHTFRPNLSIRRAEMAQIVYKGVTTP